MPSVFEWFGVRIAVASASAASTALGDVASITIWLSCPLWPTSRSCAVVSGSDHDVVLVLDPVRALRLEHALDLEVEPLSWIVWPSGSRAAEQVLDDRRADHRDAGVLLRPSAVMNVPSVTVSLRASA